MDAGARFLLRALTARDLLRNVEGEAAAPDGLVTSADVAWAIQSQCHSTILETFLASGAPKDWQALRALGAGFWLPQGDSLRAALDTAAKVQFACRKDPQDCALLFVALGKKGQLQGLYKAVLACSRCRVAGATAHCAGLPGLTLQARGYATHSGRGRSAAQGQMGRSGVAVRPDQRRRCCGAQHAGGAQREAVHLPGQRLQRAALALGGSQERLRAPLEAAARVGRGRAARLISNGACPRWPRWPPHPVDPPGFPGGGVGCAYSVRSAASLTCQGAPGGAVPHVLERPQNMRVSRYDSLC